MTKKILIPAILVAAIMVFVVRQNISLNRLRENSARLEQPVLEVDRLRQENQELSERLAQVQASSATDPNQTELLRLRAEVTRLQTQLTEIRETLKGSVSHPQQTKATPPTPSINDKQHPDVEETLPYSAGRAKESWKFAGYSTPMAALESMLWAELNGDVSALMQSYTPETRQWMLENRWRGKSEYEIAGSGREKLATTDGFRLTGLLAYPGRENEIRVLIEPQGEGENTFDNSFVLQHIDDQWKVKQRGRAESGRGRRSTSPQ